MNPYLCIATFLKTSIVNSIYAKTVKNGFTKKLGVKEEWKEKK